MEVGDCFYSKKESSLYIIKSISNGIVMFDTLGKYINCKERSGYILFSQSVPVSTEFFALGKRVDLTLSFKILKLLQVNFIVCKNILNSAEPGNDAAFYIWSNHIYLYNENVAISIGDRILGVASYKLTLNEKQISTETFTRLLEEVNKTLDLIDEIWNIFSESKENG